MPDFEYIGTYEEFLAQEPEGEAVLVTDSTMEPVIFRGDVVRLEKREAVGGEVVCLDIDGNYVFGYRVGSVLQRENGPDIPLSGTELGVAVTVIDRDLTRSRRRRE